MKVPVLFVPVCLFFFVLSAGCSRDDPPPALSSPPKVVQTIQPPAEPREAPEAESKEILQAEEDGKPGLPKDELPAGTEVLLDKAPSPAEKAEAPARKRAEKIGGVDPERAGIYVVKKGDTLTGVAAHPDVMEDPLKWPILLGLNRDKFGDQPIGEDFAARELPTGMELRFISPGQARQGVEKAQGPMWVVNVMSASDGKDIVPPAVLLAKEGYPTYITRAYVKGKDYLRLRVGFFPSRNEAVLQGEKVKKLLGFEEFWATRVDDVEYEAVAGFLKTP